MLMKEAKLGKITPEMKAVAEYEKVSVDFIRRHLAEGQIIIVSNVKRRDKLRRFVGVGTGLFTKVNANIGTSTLVVDLEMEKRKLKTAIRYGADTVMDLSTGGDLDKIRRELIAIADIPFGTVPIYQAAIETAQKRRSPIYMTEDDILRTIEKHLKDGVDFMTIHAGILLQHVKKMKKIKRAAGIVSRGGAILAAWMLHNEQENPLYKNWDYMCEMFAEYDATISIGDALRPGGLSDAHDYYQIAEMLVVSELVKRAWEYNVQVMVEGPGHMPLDIIQDNIRLEKRLCHGAPYYVLGPIVTDIAQPYDHIASAIGAALAAAAGADLICYVTPSEHLSLPNEEQVKLGVIGARIAAHAGDIIKLGRKARKLDDEITLARARQDWKKAISLAISPEEAEKVRNQFGPAPSIGCSMCGELCVYILLRKYLES